MEHHLDATVKCTLIGQFVEDACESSPVCPGVPLGQASEIQKTHLVAVFEDDASVMHLQPALLRTFVVLLRDSRSINVRGTRLEYAVRQGEGPPAHYLIHLSSDKDQRTVAIFDAQAVIGIYEEVASMGNGVSVSKT